MKKLILLLSLAFVMYGCDLENMPVSEAQHRNDYTIVVIDSCEYVRTSYYDVHYTHKGNCKYCAERRKKEQEELIRKIKEQ